MKAIRISLFLLLFISFILPSIGQTNTLYKGWEIYTSMQDVRSVDIKGTSVWAATTGGLFTFELSDQTNIKKYTNIQGLLNNQLNALKIDNSGNIYTGSLDGSISVLNVNNETWRYVTDISQSTEPSKQINHFFLYGNDLFIATEFSIIRFDVDQFNFVDQPYIYLGSQIPVKPAVKETYVHNDTIWAVTKFGISMADINNNLPIQSNWLAFTQFNSNLPTSNVHAVTAFNNRIYFGTDSSMLYYEDGQLTRYIPSHQSTPLNVPVTEFAVYNEFLYFSTGGTDNSVYKVNVNNLNEAELLITGVVVNSLIVSSTGDLYVGTGNKGLLKNNENDVIIPNGPTTNLFNEITVDQNQNFWGTSGTEGFYRYNGTTWTNFTVQKYPQIVSNGWRRIYASKYSNLVWVGGFGPGLLKIDGDSITRYDQNNSILKEFGSNFILVEGMDEDPTGDFWLLNRATTHPVVNFTDQLAWPAPENPSQWTLINLAVDRYLTKWMTYPSDVIGSERGISYLNEGANSQKIIRAGELGQDITNANDVVVDNNGEVWVATDNGVVIIANPFEVVANPNSLPNRQKMRIIENGLATPLTENVMTITVDALNNKWLGTNSNGVIYVSSDGSTILQQFNTTNSPLPDNQVSSIAVDNKTGRVYFGTQKGAASFQTVAITALEDCDVIKVGPNPFVIPNENLLRIDGLTEGSSIKILSVSGTLIAEFESPGGRIGNWDGKDRSGNLVPTGIYIIVGYNSDGSKVCTGKVAVIRK